MPGLWLNANEYVDFADTADRAALAGELATRATAMEWIDFMGLLPDPDPVLAKLDDRGDKVLDGLRADGHLISVVQSRKLGTLKKEFHFVPGCLKGEEPSAAAVKLPSSPTVTKASSRVRFICSVFFDSDFRILRFIWTSRVRIMRSQMVLTPERRWSTTSRIRLS